MRPGAISIAFGMVSFFMVDGEKTVRVDISPDAWAEIGGPPPQTKDAYLDVLTNYRPSIRQIATRKYLAGLYEREVNVLVVRITPEDLA
jgi:hypothetical protein